MQLKYINEKPLLTIAIPTFNRERYLKELLPKMLEQIEQEDPKCHYIQLLIVNNASTDGTNEIIKNTKNDRISYFINKTNIGADKNFLECIKHSTGEYVWLFGDDDLLEEKSIEKVMLLLKRNEFDLIIANDKNYSTKIQETTIFSNYGNLIEYIHLTNPHFILAHTLITSNIFRKKIFDVNRANQMLLSNYGHMYAIIDHLAGGGAIYVSNDPMIAVREQRAHFASAPKNIYLKQAKYLFYVGKKFNDSFLKKSAFYFLFESYIQTIISSLSRVFKRIFNKMHSNKKYKDQ